MYRQLCRIIGWCVSCEVGSGRGFRSIFPFTASIVQGESLNLSSIVCVATVVDFFLFNIRDARLLLII